MAYPGFCHSETVELGRNSGGQLSMAVISSGGLRFRRRNSNTLVIRGDASRRSTLRKEKALLL